MVLLAGCLGLIAGLSPVRARADTGQIAVIEDTAGTILPAIGTCENLFYPRGLCLPPAGRAFYQTHPDEYDALVFVTTAPLAGMNDAKASAPMNADIAGIGWDTAIYHYSHLNSAGRLQVAVTLGTLSSLPDDPLNPFSYPPIRGVEVAAHEIAHRWLAYIQVDHDDGAGARDILRDYINDGAGNHWSCWFNTGGSIHYGGTLTDNGDGSFTDNYGNRRFSQLDQYLMGLRAPQEVDPMYYVVVNYSLHGCADMPGAPGTSSGFEGRRVDFTIDDVIRANGARVPESSSCHLKVGFVLVHPAGSPPTTAEIEKTERYRTALEAWWAEASDGRGSLDTRLDGCGTGTSACPGDVSSQCGTMPDGDTDGDDDETPPDGDESCEFNDFRCNAQGQVEICNPNGQWQWLENCTNGQICRDGGCVADADGDTDGDMSNPDGDTSADGDDSDPDGDDAADGDSLSDGDDPGLSDGDAAFPNPDGDDPQAGQSGGSGGGCVQASGSFSAGAPWLLLTPAILRFRRRKSLATKPGIC